MGTLPFVIYKTKTKTVSYKSIEMVHLYEITGYELVIEIILTSYAFQRY